jgi:hypothetical protein
MRRVEGSTGKRREPEDCRVAVISSTDEERISLSTALQRARKANEKRVTNEVELHLDPFSLHSSIAPDRRP